MSDEVDYAAFADDDFDAVAWVNDVMRRRPADEPLDRHVSAVAVKLQMLSHTGNDTIEEGMQSLTLAVARSAREVDTLERTTRLLQDDLGALEARLAELEAGTGDSEDQLGRLNAARHSAAACAAMLAEAAQWTKLVRSVSLKFADDQLFDVADDLRALKQSLTVLSEMPEAEDREQTLAKLLERFEALVKPKLLELLRGDQAQADERLAPFVAVFDKLGMLPTLEEEYVAARQGQLHRLWFAYAADPFESWLRGFHRDALAVVHAEARSCGELFGEARRGDVLRRLLVTTFEPLASSCRDRLRDDFSLPTLCAVYAESLAFCAEAAPHDVEVAAAVTAPFAEFLDEYGGLEAGFLRQTAPALAGAEAAAELAVDRCLALTRGAGLPALCEALQVWLGSLEAEAEADEGKEGTFADGVARMRLAGEHAAALAALDQRLQETVRRAATELEQGPTEAEAEAEAEADLGLLLARRRLRASPQLSADLRALANRVVELLQPVLPGALAAAAEQQQAAAAAAFETTFRPVRASFRKLPGLDSWAAADARADPLPHAYLTEVGEHLLGLVQELEPFSDLPVPQGLSLSEGELRLLALVMGVGDAEHAGLAELFRCAASSTDFCSYWLAEVSRATCCCFVAQLLQIPRVAEPGGLRHVLADATYLGNVVKAQDLEVPGVLGLLQSFGTAGAVGGGSGTSGVEAALMQSLQKLLMG